MKWNYYVKLSFAVQYAHNCYPINEDTVNNNQVVTPNVFPGLIQHRNNHPPHGVSMCHL